MDVHESFHEISDPVPMAALMANSPLSTSNPAVLGERFSALSEPSVTLHDTAASDAAVFQTEETPPLHVDVIECGEKDLEQSESSPENQPSHNPDQIIGSSDCPEDLLKTAVEEETIAAVGHHDALGFESDKLEHSSDALNEACISAGDTDREDQLGCSDPAARIGKLSDDASAQCKASGAVSGLQLQESNGVDDEATNVTTEPKVVTPEPSENTLAEAPVCKPFLPEGALPSAPEISADPRGEDFAQFPLHEEFLRPQSNLAHQITDPGNSETIHEPVSDVIKQCSALNEIQHPTLTLARESQVTEANISSLPCRSLIADISVTLPTAATVLESTTQDAEITTQVSEGAPIFLDAPDIASEHVGNMPSSDSGGSPVGAPGDFSTDLTNAQLLLQVNEETVQASETISIASDSNLPIDIGVSPANDDQPRNLSSDEATPGADDPCQTFTLTESIGETKEQFSDTAAQAVSSGALLVVKLEDLDTQPMTSIIPQSQLDEVIVVSSNLPCGQPACINVDDNSDQHRQDSDSDDLVTTPGDLALTETTEVSRPVDNVEDEEVIKEQCSEEIPPHVTLISRGIYLLYRLFLADSMITSHP